MDCFDLRRRDLRAGFTLELSLRLATLDEGQTLLDARQPDGRGLRLRTVEGGAVELMMHDGQTDQRWACDAGLLRAGVESRLSVIVDGGPKLILFVVDGVLCDGGDQRQFGWGRFSPHLAGPCWTETARLPPRRAGAAAP